MHGGAPVGGKLCMHGGAPVGGKLCMHGGAAVDGKLVTLHAFLMSGSTGILPEASSSNSETSFPVLGKLISHLLYCILIMATIEQLAL